MNDRLLWRLWKPTDIYLWSYGPFHNQAYDSRKFYLQTYSSTDLIKSSCDEKELFTSKIKCLKGKHSQQVSISKSINRTVFLYRWDYFDKNTMRLIKKSERSILLAVKPKD